MKEILSHINFSSRLKSSHLNHIFWTKISRIPFINKTKENHFFIFFQELGIFRILLTVISIIRRNKLQSLIQKSVTLQQLLTGMAVMALDAGVWTFGISGTSSVEMPRRAAGCGRRVAASTVPPAAAAAAARHDEYPPRSFTQLHKHGPLMNMPKASRGTAQGSVCTLPLAHVGAKATMFAPRPWAHPQRHLPFGTAAICFCMCSNSQPHRACAIFTWVPLGRAQQVRPWDIRLLDGRKFWIRDSRTGTDWSLEM
jgi:hypothetical protein